ncbi:zf-HC2 domain-containing protein [Actinosynnema pretiosum]|uniref:zf-HC2 domain-containing protein n=1 Tax=Actinosynnema pretiosum TaxID=42197 RepID=UPI002FC92F9D
MCSWRGRVGRTARGGDDVGVVCETCREALSARMDGEVEHVAAAEVDAHLAGCAECARWQARAQALTRALRVRPAEASPDLVGSVLADAPPRRVAVWQRTGLAGVALVQLWLGLAQLLGGGADGHAGSGHLFTESAAWNLALGVGLLVAALREARVGALLPALGGFVAVLAAFSAYDLATGVATLERVATHLPAVAGLVLLHLVDRAHRDSAPPGGRAGAEDDERGRSDDEPGERGGRPDGGRGPRPLRPTARHVA